jgi:AcrR family transcriptional regulator
MTTGTLRVRASLVREREILETAGKLLLGHGYHGVNIGRIAEALEISRATVYQYFTSKEDVYVALAIECLEARLALMERATTFKGKTRERIVAVGVAAELAMRLHFDQMRIAEVVRTQAAVERAIPSRQVSLRTCQTRAIGILLGIVRDAIAQDDLVLPPGATPESLCFGCWITTVGGYGTLVGTLSLTELGLSDVYAAVRTNYHLLADGYRWRPLSTEYDYDAVAARILKTVFPEEMRLLNMNNASLKRGGMPGEC